jgi:hypothetical protein
MKIAVRSRTAAAEWAATMIAFGGTLCKIIQMKIGVPRSRSAREYLPVDEGFRGINKCNQYQLVHAGSDVPKLTEQFRTSFRMAQRPAGLHQIVQRWNLGRPTDGMKLARRRGRPPAYLRLERCFEAVPRQNVP